MPTQVIRIKGSNTSTGYLDLSDNGHTSALKHNTIKWQIDNHSGVYSITRIEEKTNSDNIFETPPHEQGNYWTGVISRSVHPGDEYLYSIYWKASQNGPEYKHDPKISIRPSLSPIIKILAFVVALISISVFIQLSMKKEKK